MARVGVVKGVTVYSVFHQLADGSIATAFQPTFNNRVDVIARVYGEDANPESFFHHELFQLYHRQFPDPAHEGTLLRALWAEGLAQLGADRLNPGTPESVLLGLPLSSPRFP